jgi:hypothetical protein
MVPICLSVARHLSMSARLPSGRINFRGTYSFPIDRYAARILRAAADTMTMAVGRLSAAAEYLAESKTTPVCCCASPRLRSANLGN